MTKLPMSEKQVDRIVGLWFTFGRNVTDGGIDIADSLGNDSVFSGLPPDVAKQVEEAHDRFRQELYRILCGR